jgi:hypothetical protein
LANLLDLSVQGEPVNYRAYIKASIVYMMKSGRRIIYGKQKKRNPRIYADFRLPLSITFYLP